MVKVLHPIIIIIVIITLTTTATISTIIITTTTITNTITIIIMTCSMGVFSLLNRSGLLVWLSEVEQRLDAVRESREGREAILRELEERKTELEIANKLAVPLRKIGALQPLEESLASCNFRWEQVRKQLDSHVERDDSQVKELAKKSKSISPAAGRSVKRSSEASDITGRIKRVREAISAVETQLKTTVLTGRRWENLDLQEEVLAKVRTGDFA